MNADFGKVFGGVIAVVLLLLYAITMAVIAWQVVECGTKEDCSVTIPEGTTYVLTTVGGLVSALVVAALAATKPGDSPSAIWSETQTSRANFITNIYLGIWVLVGLIALVVGVMLFPDENQTIKDAGTTWLGLAVAAGYAYFGIRPPS
jgi:hypothetical protein